MPTAVESRQQVQFGEFALDLRTGDLWRDGQRHILPYQCFQILAALLQQPGEMLTREELVKRLWASDVFVDFEGSLNKAIKRLREALNDSADQPRFIETLPRRGYRFIAPVTPSPEPDINKNVLIGKKVSHYRVLRVIGGGGMGMVYEAEDLKLGRRVALKFLPEELSSDPIALQRFEREARAASALNHLNICTVHDILEHEGRPVLVMELLEGETLRDRLAVIKTEPLALDELLDIALQTCNGLHAAHSKGIIHRDIKPANIFLTSSGQAKILDFGLAKLVVPGGKEQVPDGATPTGEPGRESAITEPLAPHDTPTLSDATLTRAGVALGTAGYMSPEQVRGEQLDARTDIFSFGLVLYEMAAGQRAFSGQTAAIVHSAILHDSPTPVRDLNSTIPAKLVSTISKALEKDREQRWQSVAELRTELEQIKIRQQPQRRHRAIRLTIAALLLIGTATAAWRYWRAHHPVPLTERDTIVLSDFDNKTGDPVFDETLKQGLAIQLEQSPFLSLISDRRVNDTLKLMGQAAAAHLTPEVTREVCLRTNSKAMLTGSIVSLDSEYVIGIKAVNCETGDVLANEQQRAAGKDAVLRALDTAAVSLRSKLGESLNSIQKYGLPLDQVTTRSLQALQAYSMAKRAYQLKGNTASLQFYKRAVELDPSFAIAYANLSNNYYDRNEVAQATEYARKAFELRDNASESERFIIDEAYYFDIGALEKAERTVENWRQSYPRSAAIGTLGGIHLVKGEWEKALGEYQAELEVTPDDSFTYANIALADMALNRLDDAEAVYRQADERRLENEFLLRTRYYLAFLKGDAAQMARLASSATGKSGAEHPVLAAQADTEAWYGRLKKARELTERAVFSARQNDAKESAASYQAAAALYEAAPGLRKQATSDANGAVSLAPNRDVQALAALALAQAGETARAEKLASALDKDFPMDTLVQEYWLPTIRATLALQRNAPKDALDLLEAVRPMELGNPTTITVYMVPVYVRGQAYLKLRDGKGAALELQKFIDHRGVVLNFAWGALARLELARAYALQAQTDPTMLDRARAAYEYFLNLWKDADSDIPIYQQAKAEYAKVTLAGDNGH